MILDIIFATAIRVVTTTPDYITEAQKEWEGLAEVTVITTKCGFENAGYYPGLNIVEMCEELYAKPDLALFVFNHEMGHAFMDQRGVPNSERGADELAVLMSPPWATIAGAQWFMEMAMDDDGMDGVHQSHMERAASLVCLLDGFNPEPVSLTCVAYAGSVTENWARMLLMTSE